MPVDVTGLYFICPICDKPFDTYREVQRHITREGGEHEGINGFETEKTITTIYNKYEKMTLKEKIIEAADRFEKPLTYENAEKVAEKADVSKNEILRIWKDSDIELQEIHHATRIYWDDLTDRQKEILKYYYHNPELEDSNNTDITYNLLCKIVDTSNVMPVIKKHGWMLEDDYRPDHLDEKADEYDLSKHIIDDEEEEQETEEETEEDTEGKLTDDEILEALNHSNVNYSIEFSLEEDRFEAISKLIENGHKEIARNFYE